MTTAADRLVNAVIRKVQESGVLWSGVQMATVSAVGTDGTITVTRDSDTFPRVRLLGSYAPLVGDRVEIMRTLGGWVCLGPLQAATSSVVDMRAGTVTITPSAANTPTFANVTYPALRGNAFYAQVTPITTVPGTSVLGVGATNVSSTGMRVYLTRANTTETVIHWAVFGTRS